MVCETAHSVNLGDTPANFKGLDVSVDIVGDFHPSFGQGIVVVSSSALYDIGYFNFWANISFFWKQFYKRQSMIVPYLYLPVPTNMN